MKSGYLLLLLLLQYSISLAQLSENTSQVYQSHTVAVTSSCNKIGSGVIIQHTGNKYVVATAKHLFVNPKDPLCTSPAMIRIYPTHEVIPFEIMFLDPDTLMDLALIAFESNNLTISQLNFDASHDLNDHFYLVSTLEEWNIIPPPARKSTLLAINSARTRAKLYMEGIADGHSGSGYFTKDGLSGIVYYQEGESNKVRTITINYIEERLKQCTTPSK